MTPEQREASLFLHEFICRHTGISPSEVHPHKQFFSTECPGALKASLGQFRRDLATRLTHGPRPRVDNLLNLLAAGPRPCNARNPLRWLQPGPTGR